MAGGTSPDHHRDHPRRAGPGAVRDGVLRLEGGPKPLPGRQGSAATTCSSEKQVQKFLTRHDVQVSVFNAGNRSGLAGVTLDKLETAGFNAGNAGNAPGTAEVRRRSCGPPSPTTQREARGPRLRQAHPGRGHRDRPRPRGRRARRQPLPRPRQEGAAARIKLPQPGRDLRHGQLTASSGRPQDGGALPSHCASRPPTRDRAQPLLGGARAPCAA